MFQECARDEWVNETKKCQIAMNEYQEEIKKMLSRLVQVKYRLNSRL